MHHRSCVLIVYNKPTPRDLLVDALVRVPGGGYLLSNASFDIHVLLPRLHVVIVSYEVEDTVLRVSTFVFALVVCDTVVICSYI